MNPASGTSPRFNIVEYCGVHEDTTDQTTGVVHTQKKTRMEYDEEDSTGSNC